MRKCRERRKREEKEKRKKKRGKGRERIREGKKSRTLRGIEQQKGLWQQCDRSGRGDGRKERGQQTKSSRQERDMRTMFEDVQTTGAENRWWWRRVEERDSEREPETEMERATKTVITEVLKSMSRHGDGERERENREKRKRGMKRREEERKGKEEKRDEKMDSGDRRRLESDSVTCRTFIP